jgi:hypothetical protein
LPLKQEKKMRLTSLWALAATPVIAPQAQAQVAAADEAQEVVVTAQRAGAPVWRVRSATGTLVLVGSIDNVAAGTAWRPEALAETVGKSNRVMFPQMIGINLSPISLVGYYAKWKRRARLPNGQSLSGMMSKADFARLARLARQGLAPADFDRWHPLHLSFNMQDRLRKRTGLMEAPTATVSRATSKFKVARVPIQRASARPLADTIFRSQPVEHLPCLTATIAAVEGGPEGLRQRSRDWAGKRVQAALAAPSQAMGNACWPSNTNILDPSQLATTARRTLDTRGTTLAVVNLETLARPGGLLDTLRADGRQVDGPMWR